MVIKSWVERLRQHATVHYTEDGWDILVECWTDEYIAEQYSGCGSYTEAVMKISDVLATMDRFRTEIQNA